jgi:type I restriction enzyme R subunit
MNWVKLHPTNISQKVQIIIEHFRENVGWRLDGKAKAMVVTSSRKAAVRYKLAFDKYIAEQRYTDVAALVLRVVETFTFSLLGQLSGACGPGVAVA